MTNFKVSRRRLVISSPTGFTIWIFRPAAAAVILLFATAAIVPAEDSSDPAAQGRVLVQQLLAVQPAQNYTNTGVMHIRDGSGNQTDVPVRCEIHVTATNWATAYAATIAPNQIATLYIIHTADQANEYYYRTNDMAGGIPILSPRFRSSRLAGEATMTAFAGSDFWFVDLGQEFLHWPQQKVLKKEIKRSQGCTVLESTNPQPAAGGYARVVSWVDTENGGFVQAFAYDASGQKLKEFYPKEIKKINGQWQVGMMEMDNDQTDSRTRLEFNLNSSGSDSQK